MSTSSRPPFIVVGTGRCGTISIAHILNQCANTEVTHEEHLLPWHDRSTPMVGEIIEEFKDKEKQGITRGMVGYMYLPHLPEIRSACRNLRVVRMWRDKESTVDSFLRFGLFIVRSLDKQSWTDKTMGKPRDYAKTFPLIDAASVKQSIEFYWEYYTKLMRDKVREPVFDLKTEELNEDDKLYQLCDFLGIPKCDIAFPEARKYHADEAKDDPRFTVTNRIAEARWD